MHKKINKQKGYTIIETMISISIFLIVVMIGMGSLLNANLLHQKSQNMRSIMDNLSFIIEDMGKNLRTGYNYQCFRKNIDTTVSLASMGVPRSCADGWAIAFEAASGDTSTYADEWAYYISNDGKIFKSTDGANSFFQLTPDEVVINAVVSGFSVLGAEPPQYNSNGNIIAGSDLQQPFVTIKLVGTITSNNIVTPFSLQTSVSQRIIDI